MRAREVEVSNDAARRTQTETSRTGSSLGGDAHQPWVAGAQFSRYEIDSRLAGGGMAEVWRAKLKGVQGFEKRIVIKTMLTHLQHRSDLVQMFIDEAQVAAQLSHPNIVHVFDFGQLEGRYFIAMEYIPGVTLRFAHKRALARAERLPVKTILHVMSDICEALQHLHELGDDRGRMGLVHRDLSPDNVILSTSGTAKLIDFGAARATARSRPSRMFVGKYRYAAPERIRQDGEDARSDVYSVGVILYECLAGARPFDGPDAEVMRAAVAREYCDPRARVDTLPERVARAVCKATARRPEDRFPDARALAAELRGCLADLGSYSKERDVTEALAWLLDPVTAGAAPDPGAITPGPEAVPEPIEIASFDREETAATARTPSDTEVALCEVEILEATGPIHLEGVPVARPTTASRPLLEVKTPPPVLTGVPVARGPSASGQPVLGWRTASSQPPPNDHRLPPQRAVELFDRGLELRAAGYYGAALDAWEKALRLAPGNRVYQSSVKRLREQLQGLRAALAAIAGRS